MLSVDEYHAVQTRARARKEDEAKAQIAGLSRKPIAVPESAEKEEKVLLSQRQYVVMGQKLM